jgi:hypothetical protein
LAEAIRRLDAASAELDVAQAADDEQMRQTSMQALKEAINMEALSAAERNAAGGAKEKALADIAAAQASNKAASANGTNATRMGLIVGAIAALIPLLGPLSGYAVGVSGALAGMGAAGVLAILGIKNAMADGTAAGNTFAAGLQVLKGNLDQLEQTAASGIMSGFQSAISTIDAAMPALNSEIGVFSQQLGVVGNLVLQGVITGFQVLNPLFVTAGVYIEQIGAGFASWTSNGGLASFSQMALQYFPQVVQTLGSLLQGIMALISGLAPLGGAMLSVLTAAGGMLTVIGDLVGLLSNGLGPAFGPIIVGAGAAFAAFKLWGVVAPLIQSVASSIYAATGSVTALGIAADAATGPVGWVVAAISAVGAAFAIAASNSADATSSMNTFTAAVQQDSGAIGENVTKQAAANLQKAGALAAAQQLGISTHRLVQAVLGEGDAHDKLVTSLKTTIKAGSQLVDTGSAMVVVQDANAKAAQKVLDAVNAQGAGVKGAVDAYNAIAGAIGGTTIKTKAQLQAQIELAATYGMSVTDFQAAQAAQQKNAASATAATQALQLENDAAGLLTNAFTLLNGGSLSLMQAQTGAAAAGNTLLAALKKNGTQLDGNSVAAVANQQALEGKAQADQQAAEAVAKSTGSTQKGTQAFADSKKALEDELRAQGNLTPAVQAYIDKLYAIPPVVQTKVEADTAAAAAKIAAIAAQLAGLNSNAAALQAQVNSGQAVASGHSTVYKAAGGMVDAAYLASGGSPFVPKGTDTRPAMLSPHEFVVKAPSAQAYPGFMQAYNDNPTRALQAVQQSGGQNMTVSLAGATIYATIDGQPIRLMIQDQIVSASSSKRVQLSTGLQQTAY